MSVAKRSPISHDLHGGSAMTSTTLNLVDHLLSRGRYFQQLGRPLDALRILSRLAGYRELPAAVAEEVQFRLGELQLGRKKYARARRHLAAALRHAPDNPRYQFLLGRAHDNDRDGDPARAAEHYSASLALDGTQTDCLCAHGSLALRLNRTEEGLECLRGAARLAPDDVKVLAKVVAALRTAGRADEARGLLLAARFRNARDGRYLKLWNDFQFHAARREQDAARSGKAFADDGPVLLPFRRLAREAAPRSVVAGKIIRADGPTTPAPHRGPARVSDQRQAQ
jgi:tetratricopeptide (TPR) repeat protein